MQISARSERSFCSFPESLSCPSEVCPFGLRLSRRASGNASRCCPQSAGSTSCGASLIHGGDSAELRSISAAHFLFYCAPDR